MKKIFFLATFILLISSVVFATDYFARLSKTSLPNGSFPQTGESYYKFVNETTTDDDMVNEVLHGASADFIEY